MTTQLGGWSYARTVFSNLGKGKGKEEGDASSDGECRTQPHMKHLARICCQMAPPTSWVKLGYFSHEKHRSTFLYDVQ